LRAANSSANIFKKQSVLVCFAERSLAPVGDASSVLADALWLLSHPALQVRSDDVKSGATHPSDEQQALLAPDESGDALAAAKSRILCGVVKSYVLSNVVPVVISVRMAVLRTPLMNDVTRYLLFLVTEYGDDALSSIVDRRVVGEVRFDRLATTTTTTTTTTTNNALMNHTTFHRFNSS
jgi:hypothetical protein